MKKLTWKNWQNKKLKNQKTGRLKNWQFVCVLSMNQETDKLKNWQVEKLTNQKTDEQKKNWQTEKNWQTCLCFVNELKNWQMKKLTQKNWQNKKLKNQKTDRLKNWQFVCVLSMSQETDKLKNWQMKKLMNKKIDRLKNWQTCLCFVNELPNNLLHKKIVRQTTMTKNRLLKPVGKFSDLSLKQRNKLFKEMSEVWSESAVDDLIQSIKNVNHREKVRKRLKRLRSSNLAKPVNNAVKWALSQALQTRWKRCSETLV